MNTRSYAITSSVIFLLVALLHVLRLIQQWDIVIGTWHMPIWTSIMAAIVTGFLSFQGFRLFRQGQWFSWLR